MRVMIVVTHLLGTGHLARALTLGRALAAAGRDVTVVSGGGPVPHFDTSGLRLVQLPPLRSDGVDFTRLLDADGAVATDALHAARLALLSDTLAETAPQVLITELFPFGRRILRAEFGALLAQAGGMQPRPLVLCSIRDILAPPSKPAKAAFADDMVAQFYDGVLVHSDPDLIPLDRSWPVSDMLAERLHYTGFVAPAPPDADVPQHGEVLVSAGGGAVGDALFDLVLGAARRDPDRTWRCLVGGGPERLAQIAARAPANLSVDPPRPDFRTLLQGAAASVSMCGYNTAMDILQTGVPALFVPFDEGGEVEQGIRADALAAQPGIASARLETLTPDGVLAALDRVIAAPERPRRTHGMSGAEATVGIIDTLYERHAHGT